MGAFGSLVYLTLAVTEITALFKLGTCPPTLCDTDGQRSTGQR